MRHTSWEMYVQPLKVQIGSLWPPSDCSQFSVWSWSITQDRSARCRKLKWESWSLNLIDLHKKDDKMSYCDAPVLRVCSLTLHLLHPVENYIIYNYRSWNYWFYQPFLFLSLVFSPLFQLQISHVSQKSCGFLCHDVTSRVHLLKFGWHCCVWRRFYFKINLSRQQFPVSLKIILRSCWWKSNVWMWSHEERN